MNKLDIYISMSNQMCANGCDIICIENEFVCNWCHHQNRKLKERRGKHNMSQMENWVLLLLTSPYHEIPKIFLPKVNEIQKFRLEHLAILKCSVITSYSEYFNNCNYVQIKIETATNDLKKLYGPEIVFRAVELTNIFPKCISNIIAEYAVCY
jgi:hypothetical protein